jgi:hypothetical protein
MHSLPAMFTLPIRVRPDKFRSLTVLIVLLIFFVLLPPSLSSVDKECPFLSRFPSSSGMAWLWWDQAEVQFPVVEHTDYELIWDRVRPCFERTYTPWWDADSITH